LTLEQAMNKQELANLLSVLSYNPRLIAAAPALLEALRFYAQHGADVNRRGDAGDMARAALAQDMGAIALAAIAQATAND